MAKKKTRKTKADKKESTEETRARSGLIEKELRLDFLEDRLLVPTPVKEVVREAMTKFEKSERQIEYDIAEVYSRWAERSTPGREAKRFAQRERVYKHYRALLDLTKEDATRMAARAHITRLEQLLSKLDGTALPPTQEASGSLEDLILQTAGKKTEVAS